MKSYVKKKPLLVYVHRTTDSNNANMLMKQLLQDKKINAFLVKMIIIVEQEFCGVWCI
jgi:hypothetical protein